MASEWELGMGMEFGYGMGIGASVSPSLIIASAAPHAPNYQPAAMNSSAYLYSLPSTDTLRIDDLLDFSSHDVLISSSSSAAAANPNTNTDADGLIIPKQEIPSSSVTAAGCRPFAGESGSSHSHVSSFADGIYIPTEEAAELEWLSKFVEDSFSDVPYPSNYLPAGAHVRMGPAAAAAAAAASPGRGARSKRSRAASTNLKPPALAAAPNQASSPTSTSSSSSSDFPTPAHISTGGVSSGRKMAVNEAFVGMEGGVRRCTHCASEKTPQWRTGPLGPKTLCNACGVRYKSGRLVPEYRPAASPTFVLTQHSNSHRKVVELRRQKEQLHSYHQDPNPCNSSAGAANAIIYH